MKNYAIPICLVLFFFLVLISCEQKASKQEAKDQEASKLVANNLDKPSDRGKIDDTRPFVKVEGSDTIIVRICLWDMNANTKKPEDSIFYAKVLECDIPCSFTLGCDEEGDFVKFKRKKIKLDSVEVEIRSYEYKEKKNN